MERYRTSLVIMLVAAVALAFVAACFVSSPATVEHHLVPDGIRAISFALGGDAVAGHDRSDTAAAFTRTPAPAAPGIPVPLLTGAARTALAASGSQPPGGPIAIQSRPLRI